MDIITQSEYRSKIKGIKQLFGAKKASSSYGEEYITTQLLRCLPFRLDKLLELFRECPSIVVENSGIVLINDYICIDLVFRYNKGAYDDIGDEII